MPVPIIVSSLPNVFSYRYIVHVALSCLILAILRAYAQGRKTNRDRDLHARTILLTGGFTPIGLTLLESLAKRGAHIIAVCPDPIDAPHVSLLVDALRSTTSNEHIFAEHCVLTSPKSIREFCTNFLTGNETRIDAMIFAHEYSHIGAMLGGNKEAREAEKEKRFAGSLKRDIRIINVINPFHAAAIPLFLRELALSTSDASQRPVSDTQGPLLTLEGRRALYTVILTRHLQRVFDALPSAPAPDPQAPDPASLAQFSSSGKRTEQGKDASGNNKPGARKSEGIMQRSNIVAVSVSPGISRVDTIAPMLGATWGSKSHGSGPSSFGFILYILLQPLLRIFTKTPSSSIQSILHALFLPTPFKLRLSDVGTDSASNTGSSPKRNSRLTAGEILKPGSLYADCSVVDVDLKVPENLTQPKGKDREKKGEDAELEDDGEMGGEEIGRSVWERYEAQLKTWESKEKEEKQKFNDASVTSVGNTDKDKSS